MTTNNFSGKNFEIVSRENFISGIVHYKLKGKLNFKPGQFVQVRLPHIGEATFAPCSDPKDQEHFSLCIRSCGSTTNEMVDLLPGGYLEVRGPYGNGWPIRELKNKDIVLVSGGLGVVPLRPLIFDLLRTRSSYGRISLFSGFRTQAHLLFREDFENWSKLLDLNVYTEQKNNDKLCHHGMVTEGIERHKLKIKQTIALICGPEVMILPVVNSLLQKGITKEQMFVSLERRMECGIGVCQHCNIGKYLVCKDGPIFRFDQIEKDLGK